MKNMISIRFEYDPAYPNEVWVYDRIHGRELCKIVSTDDVGEYLKSRLDDIVVYGDYLEVA